MMVGWYWDKTPGVIGSLRWWNGQWWSAAAHEMWDAETAGRQASIRSSHEPTAVVAYDPDGNEAIAARQRIAAANRRVEVPTPTAPTIVGVAIPHESWQVSIDRAWNGMPHWLFEKLLSPTITDSPGIAVAGSFVALPDDLV